MGSLQTRNSIATLALLALFTCATTQADTVLLKNKKELKGFVVEDHQDRIILSTEKGELPILKHGIANIIYDDPERNLFQIGKAYEAENKMGFALAYYEKALEVNPNFREAREAAAGAKNRFWALNAEVPKNEIEKKQLLYDAWGQGKFSEEVIKKKEQELERRLKKSMGIALVKKGDWVAIESIEPKSAAYQSGLRIGDRLTAVNGQSLRYLSADAVRSYLAPKVPTNLNVEYERNFFIHLNTRNVTLKSLGLQVRLESDGLTIASVKDQSIAEEAGLKEGDYLTYINGSGTRYLPIAKINQALRSSKNFKRVVLTARRMMLLVKEAK